MTPTAEAKVSESRTIIETSTSTTSFHATLSSPRFLPAPLSWVSELGEFLLSLPADLGNLRDDYEASFCLNMDFKGNSSLHLGSDLNMNWIQKYQISQLQYLVNVTWASVKHDGISKERKHGNGEKIDEFHRIRIPLCFLSPTQHVMSLSPPWKDVLFRFSYLTRQDAWFNAIVISTAGRRCAQQVDTIAHLSLVSNDPLWVCIVEKVSNTVCAKAKHFFTRASPYLQILFKHGQSLDQGQGQIGLTFNSTMSRISEASDLAHCVLQLYADLSHFRQLLRLVCEQTHVSSDEVDKTVLVLLSAMKPQVFAIFPSLVEH